MSESTAQGRTWSCPAVPAGWFAVAYADEIPDGGVEPLEVLDRELVLYRGDDGKAHVLDAHCRHLGAHMGYGGKVDGEQLRCPFHGWAWGPDGHCRDVPYARQTPRNARVGAWPTCERNGYVYLWHHPDGAPPSYELPVLDEFGSKDWGDYTRLRWKVRSRLFDMGENAHDHQHFRFLHGAAGAPTLEQEILGDGSVHLHSDVEMQTKRGPVKGSIATWIYGPGSVKVNRTRGIAETIIVINETPIDVERVDVRFGYLQRRTDDPGEQRAAAAMLRDLVRQMEQDIELFEHKVHQAEPALVPEDGPIADYRKRAREWYGGS